MISLVHNFSCWTDLDDVQQRRHLHQTERKKETLEGGQTNRGLTEISLTAPQARFRATRALHVICNGTDWRSPLLYILRTLPTKFVPMFSTHSVNDNSYTIMFCFFLDFFFFFFFFCKRFCYKRDKQLSRGMQTITLDKSENGERKIKSLNN